MYLPPPKTSAPLPAWRVIVGSVLLSAGLALIATGGITDDGPSGPPLEAALPAVAGAPLVLLRRSHPPTAQ